MDIRIIWRDLRIAVTIMNLGFDVCQAVRWAGCRWISVKF